MTQSIRMLHLARFANWAGSLASRIACGREPKHPCERT